MIDLIPTLINLSMAKSMNYCTFLINLDHATERMESMDSQLQSLGISYTRISAVYGEALKEPIPEFDESGYRIRTGKHSNSGEIGCYLSHICALKAFLETDYSHALILEDDAKLPNNLIPLLEASLEASDSWDLLRLSSSREGEYI